MTSTAPKATFAPSATIKVRALVNAANPAKPKTHRYLVELHSKEQELDAYDHPVPARTLEIDVMVDEQSKDAVREALQFEGWLKDWDVALIWQECPSDEF